MRVRSAGPARKRRSQMIIALPARCMSIWDKSVTFTKKARFFSKDHLLIARCVGRTGAHQQCCSPARGACIDVVFVSKLPTVRSGQPPTCRESALPGIALECLRRSLKLVVAAPGAHRLANHQVHTSGMLAGVLASIRSTPFAHGVPRHHG